MDPQVVCVNQDCLALPVPPFQDSPYPQPNNVLVIPTQAQPGDDCSSPSLLQAAINDFETISATQHRQCLPTRMVVGDCFAGIIGCDQIGRPCRSVAFGPTAPQCLKTNTCNVEDLASRYDSGAVACGTELIVIKNPGAGNGNGNNGTFCTAPCVTVVDSLGSRCVCDPPVPSPLPRAFRKSLPTNVGMRSGLGSGGARSDLRAVRHPALKVALNPSLRVPVPAHISTDCGCGTDVFEEAML